VNGAVYSTRNPRYALPGTRLALDLGRSQAICLALRVFSVKCTTKSADFDDGTVDSFRVRPEPLIDRDQWTRIA
jgi:hypothetical protein